MSLYEQVEREYKEFLEKMRQKRSVEVEDTCGEMLPEKKKDDTELLLDCESIETKIEYLRKRYVSDTSWDRSMLCSIQESEIKEHETPPAKYQKKTGKRKKKKECVAEPGTECYNCRTTSTTLWRKTGDKIGCNACALYRNLHKTDRPPHLTKRGIKKRNRVSASR
ncbi:MAG: uncharacterized protein A8A55_1813 [Amphiamblys sp. WSBS2006]|nr:MAG: uncharacterized protein A8A55_1813 [Amphiamblys sp. WSBS2006]